MASATQVLKSRSAQHGISKASTTDVPQETQTTFSNHLHPSLSTPDQTQVSPSSQLMEGILRKTSQITPSSTVDLKIPSSADFRRASATDPRRPSATAIMIARIRKSLSHITPSLSHTGLVNTPNPLDTDERALMACSSTQLMTAILKQIVKGVASSYHTLEQQTSSAHLLAMMRRSASQVHASSSQTDYSTTPEEVNFGAKLVKSILGEIIDAIVPEEEADSATKIAQSVLADIFDAVVPKEEGDDDEEELSTGRDGPKILFSEDIERVATFTSEFIPDGQEGSDYSSEEYVESAEVKEQEIEKECMPYEGVEQFAKTVVRNIIGQSVDTVTEMGSEVEMPEEEEEEEEIETVEWPSIEDFDVDLGISALYSFIGTWSFDDDWSYCIEFRLAQSDDCSDFYLYEAKFSIPTNPYPIPQSHAIVYFTIELSRVKPAICPVNVTYVFEGTRFAHSVKETLCWEDCLFRVIDAKLAFYRTLKF